MTPDIKQALIEKAARAILLRRGHPAEMVDRYQHNRNTTFRDACNDAQAAFDAFGIEKMVEALEPFRRIADSAPANATDGDYAAVQFVDLRHARTTLSTIGEA